MSTIIIPDDTKLADLINAMHRVGITPAGTKKGSLFFIKTPNTTIREFCERSENAKKYELEE